MNKFILSELQKCQEANIPKIIEGVDHIVIPRYDRCVTRLIQHHFYIVEFDDCIINESDNSTLSANWNRGTKPLTTCNKVEVSQVMGKMIKMNCVGYDMDNDIDLNCIWSGWVPENYISIIKEL